MAVSKSFPLMFNDILNTNYQTEEDFFKDFSNISSKKIVDFLEYLNQHTWYIKTNASLMNRIFTHLTATAAERSLTLDLSRRIAVVLTNNLQFLQQKKTSGNNNNQADAPHSNFMAMKCKCDNNNEESVLVNKLLFLTSSSVLKEIDKQQRIDEITAGSVHIETAKYIEEFLFIGHIKSIDKLTSEEKRELIDIAKQWKMNELLDYLGKHAVDDHSFEFFMERALALKSVDLFQAALQGKFGHGFTVKMVDFDSFIVDIFNLHEKAEDGLDKMCQFLESLRNEGRLPKIQKFKVIANPSTNSLEESHRYIQEPHLETKFSYPQALKDVITDIDLSPTYVSINHVEKNGQIYKLNPLIVLAQQCKNFQSFTMPKYRDGGWGAYHMSHDLEELNQFSKACIKAQPNFQSLRLSFHGIKGEHLKNLEKKEYLELRKLITGLVFVRSEFYDEDLEFFGKNFPNLERFKIIDSWQCNQITDQGLEALSKGCKQLESLDLSNCIELTFKGLQSLAENCANVSFLAINNYSSPKLTDEQLEFLAKKWSKLESLYIKGTKITDQGLEHLTKYCPNLSVLDLDEASSVTDKGLKMLAAAYPNMLAFNVHHAEKITEEGLSAIAQSWPKLEWLDLSGCESIPQNSFIELMKCTNLKRLNLKRSSIQKTEIEKLKKALPKLYIESDKE